MWPKALSSLIELAPHISRLLPMADRFFLAKSADADASRTAMEQMAEGLRGDLGQVTASHAGLYRQLNDQSEKLTTLSSSLHTTQVSIETIATRLQTLESRNTTLRLLLLFNSTALLVVIILAAILLHRH